MIGIAFLLGIGCGMTLYKLIREGLLKYFTALEEQSEARERRGRRHRMGIADFETGAEGWIE